MVRLVSVALIAALQLVSAATIRLDFKPEHIKENTIPDYAIKHAPFLFLHSEESWWPSDIATHLEHCFPDDDTIPVKSKARLETLHELSPQVFLASNNHKKISPEWMLGEKLDGSGYTKAPATIILVDKIDHVDVFYFYFFSYNKGPT